MEYTLGWLNHYHTHSDQRDDPGQGLPMNGRAGLLTHDVEFIVINNDDTQTVHTTIDISESPATSDRNFSTICTRAYSSEGLKV